MWKNMDLQQAKEMAEALTLDNEHCITSLGSDGDEVAIALYAQILEMEKKLAAVSNIVFGEEEYAFPGDALHDIGRII